MIREHDFPVYLYNRTGDWIAFSVGKNLFDLDSQWLAWQPFKNQDFYTIDGNYLASIYGDRLLRRLDYIPPLMPIGTPTTPHSPGLLFPPGLAHTLILPRYLTDIEPERLKEAAKIVKLTRFTYNSDHFSRRFR